MHVVMNTPLCNTHYHDYCNTNSSATYNLHQVASIICKHAVFIKFKLNLHLAPSRLLLRYCKLQGNIQNIFIILPYA